MDNQEDVEREAQSPPYVPFRTLMNLVTRMETEGIPNRVDKSFLSNLSGGTRSHLWASLRSLGLITEDQRPTGTLIALVQAGDGRPAAVRDLLERRLPWAVSLGTTATHDELVDAFNENSPNLGVSTREKAISFYLAAASYAEMPLSKWFKSKAGAGASPRRPASPARRKAKRDTAAAATSTHKPGSEAEQSDGDMRRMYFSLLLKKAEESTDLDAGLLDRIERLIGLEDATTP
jgi:hypothetical protein